MYEWSHAFIYRRPSYRGMISNRLRKCPRPRECRHNLIYWRQEDYLGVGAGAVGCMAAASGGKIIKILRTMNVISRAGNSRAFLRNGSMKKPAVSNALMLGFCVCARALPGKRKLIRSGSRTAQGLPLAACYGRNSPRSLADSRFCCSAHQPNFSFRLFKL